MGLDYATIEAQFRPKFEYYEHDRLAELVGRQAAALGNSTVQTPD